MTGEDEISALGAAFDEMIDTVVEQRRETRDAQEALHAEKQRLAVVFDSITDAVISTDVCGRIILANKAAEKLISIENQHVLGIHVFNVCDFRCDHSENSCDDCIKNTLETKVKCSGQGEIFLKKTNKSFPVFRTSSPIFDDDGNAIGVVVVFRDIRDEIKQQEQLFKVKNLESIGVLAGGLAHDFNNILTGAIGNISLALLGINDQDDDQRDLLEGAESALLRATSLTQQLLTFSKGGNPVLEAASLSEIITETTRFILSGSALRCHFDIPEDLWRVRVDKGQIRQVVQNLALNAAQAMPHGGCLEIRCRNEEAPPLRGRVRIEFIDNGPGISPEALSRVFDPYFTTKPSGSGLGLAICHSIVNKHGGVISVDSSPQGTCFRFTLPAYFETISAPTRAAKAPLALNEAAAGRLIVIVDDEAAILEVGARMLRKVGFEVEVYPNGEALMAKRNTQEALRAVSAFILDLTIPGGMSGQAIAAAILKVDPQARLIVSSGYAHDPILSDFSAYGFTAQLKKPYTHEALQRVVTRTLSEALLS
ncbi:response regulator [Myxococcota bacterium]|nr:response regulator [Myxococcota bacterium]MBU1897259.1 response regulator [Myxococcota bacterium]